MKLSEVIALAKAGYSKKDIEAIKREEEKEEVEKPLPTEEPDEVETDVPDPEDELIEVEDDDEEETIDYKKLLEESQARLKEAQKENIKQPMPEVDNDIDIVNNFCREFL